MLGEPAMLLASACSQSCTTTIAQRGWGCMCLVTRKSLRSLDQSVARRFSSSMALLHGVASVYLWSSDKEEAVAACGV